MWRDEKTLGQALRVLSLQVEGRHNADVVRRAQVRRVGPCEMVEIDGGARTATIGPSC